MQFAEVLVSVPAIMATTEWMKSVAGLSGRASQGVAVLVGILFAFLYGATIEPLAGEALVRYFAQGLICGLGASGFYDVTLKTRDPQAGGGSGV